MPGRESFEYAVVRIVPRVEREEFINAGVIVFCLARNFLKARVQLDEARVEALWPGLPLDEIRRHLEAIEKVCDGGEGAGPLGEMSRRERFHWLVAPRSTVIQVSAVHAGLCESPEEEVGRLFGALVVVGG